MLDQVLSDKSVESSGNVLGRVEGCQELIAWVISCQSSSFQFDSVYGIGFWWYANERGGEGGDIQDIPLKRLARRLGRTVSC